MATTAGASVRAGSGNSNPVTIGALALQGDYEAHARAFASAGARTVLVRKPEELVGLDGLVMPGGESTTMLKFLEKDGFFDALGNFVSTTPCFATCAGVILLAREVLDPAQRSLGVLDATVERNAYGRQIDSTILTLPTELPAGRWRWSSSARRALPAWARRSSACPAATTAPTLVRQGHCSPPPSIPR